MRHELDTSFPSRFRLAQIIQTWPCWHSCRPGGNASCRRRAPSASLNTSPIGVEHHSIDGGRVRRTNTVDKRQVQGGEFRPCTGSLFAGSPSAPDGPGVCAGRRVGQKAQSEPANFRERTVRQMVPLEPRRPRPEVAGRFHGTRACRLHPSPDRCLPLVGSYPPSLRLHNGWGEPPKAASAPRPGGAGRPHAGDRGCSVGRQQPP